MNDVDRILDGENIREVLIGDYGIEVIEENAVFEMAKILDRRANKAITGEIPGFIYFSQVQDAHGPRIKFYGGTKYTSRTRDCPSYAFGVDGPIKVLLQPWMNKDNCPNAFDKDCLKKVADFISNHLAVLLLTWFEHLDDADVVAYFEGTTSFKELLGYAYVSNEIKEKLLKCKTEKELYAVCKEQDLYKF